MEKKLCILICYFYQFYYKLEQLSYLERCYSLSFKIAFPADLKLTREDVKGVYLINAQL